MKRQNLCIQLVMLASIMLLSACATGSPSISETTQTELEKDARTSLASLYETTPKAKELRESAKAILVFPDIFKAGLLVGGSGGNGVLFSPDEKVLGYYNAASVSYGLQAGIQDYSETMFLMTPEAIQRLDSSAGWSLGVGPSIVVVNMGVANDFSTTTARSDVFAFIYGQEGLMAGLGLQGQKITKLNP